MQFIDIAKVFSSQILNFVQAFLAQSIDSAEIFLSQFIVFCRGRLKSVYKSFESVYRICNGLFKSVYWLCKVFSSQSLVFTQVLLFQFIVISEDVQFDKIFTLNGSGVIPRYGSSNNVWGYKLAMCSIVGNVISDIY